MQSNEVETKEIDNTKSIYDIDIKEISKKTNISSNVINNLLNKKFDSFSYPQAMGSISIIEREYDIDLSEQRSECQEYFKEHPLDDGVSVIQVIPESSILIPKLLIILLLIFVSYSGWYFFSEYYNQQIIPPKNINKIELEKTIINKNDLEKNVTPKSSKVEEKNDSIQTQKVIDTNIIEDVNKSVDVDINKSEANVTMVKEENSTNNNLSPLLPATNIVVEEPVKQELTVIAPTNPIKIITLIPNEYMWFRLINLKDIKRRAYRRRSQYKIDMRENDWLFAAENTSFSFKYNDKTALYGGEGKIFYKLDQNGIHKLTKAEFRALEK